MLSKRNLTKDAVLWRRFLSKKERSNKAMLLSAAFFAGRVRAFFNDQGKKVKEAGPSIPVEIQGFDGVPEAGEEFICLADEKAARRIAESRAIKQREKELAKQSRVTLETFLASTPNDSEAKVLNLVLKADVQGSLEAITDALVKLGTDKVRISVIHSGAGAITETDIMLAAASHAIILGFNVRPTAKVKEVAEREGVDIRFYDINLQACGRNQKRHGGHARACKQRSLLGTSGNPPNIQCAENRRHRRLHGHGRQNAAQRRHQASA